MKLHCLGTTGYHPSEMRHTSCYFIPTHGIVLDAGTGLFRLPELIETDHLDILLSHAHLDHVVGLTYLLDILYQRPVDSVRVWGAAEKLQAIRAHLFSEHLFPVLPDVEWQSISIGDTIELESGIKTKTFPLVHPGGSIGFRLQHSGRSLAYVTDTTAAADAPYIQEIEGVDVLLHECNFRTTQHEWAEKTGHSSCELVGQVAAAAGAGQAWITHVNPLETGEDPVGIADARRHFSNINVLSDGQIIDF